MPVRGINHITLSVRDLDRALRFYVELLGCRARARWARGAYLEAGTLWLCLELDERAGFPQIGDSHIAFSLRASEFAAFADAIRASGATIWKENRSEGQSLYFEDPDGHKLEIHVGDLRTRLRSCRDRPYDRMELFDRAHAGRRRPGESGSGVR
jgi:catechol 2,3-dioxygenase-like lactoylglutathione lyase family enzyme